jgi:pantoate--beta-alanine ligase
MSALTVVSTVVELRALLDERRRRGETVGIVPTMGALHEGHLSLVRAAFAECANVVVSVYVNPTQFAPNEDFQRYPRNLDYDLQLLKAVVPKQSNTVIVFAPTDAEMYPAGFQTMVEVSNLSQNWEGEIRPTHFRGVATVVLKLFTAADADYAYFGQKDYQQLRVVEQMARDLNLRTVIRPCPTLREADGLAMSSRNRYLTPEERARGLALSRGLEIVREMSQRGETDCAELEGALRDVLASAGLQPDYAVVVDRVTLQPIKKLDRPAVAMVAARVGKTRLIDNLLLDAKPSVV